MAEMAEVSRPFPDAPAQLDAPQESHAILLLDLQLTQVLGSFEVQGAELERDDGARIRAGEFGDFHLFSIGETESGLVLFADLVPGHYRLVRVKGWQQSGQRRVDVLAVAQPSDSTALELAAGEVRYLHLKGHQPMFSASWDWTVVDDPSRAVQALEWVANRYPDSSWAPKLRELEGKQ